VSAQILPFSRPVAAQKADGVFAAVSMAATRMGYTNEEARRHASVWREVYCKGNRSPGWVVAAARDHLRRHSAQVQA